MYRVFFLFKRSQIFSLFSLQQQKHFKLLLRIYLQTKPPWFHPPGVVGEAEEVEEVEVAPGDEALVVEGVGDLWFVVADQIFHLI